ncbi:hypothetical protein CDL12_17412 [Handroanthus impetiginosus]|uniref:Small ribosomal subunit protein mS41 SAM domain-containing protein n=1 Tax=Handroanthus impetiginosus TaxID=429701 RepID=A0A2G9GXJ3_9LAMI|nr:hypothetical protein CDL12_17412 [Handroanthus impetiginosus]
MAWRQILAWSRTLSPVSAHSNPVPGVAKFSSKPSPYIVKVGIPEFLSGVGKGLENHVEKLESEIGDLQKLLVTRTLKLKRLGIPCKDRKLILKYAHKYRLGLWRPRAEPVKS